MRPFVILLAILLLKPLNAQDMYTLETCETDIADNVPQFFQDYFQCVKARLSVSGNYVNLYFSSLPPYESWYYDVQGATSSRSGNVAHGGKLCRVGGFTVHNKEDDERDLRSSRASYVSTQTRISRSPSLLCLKGVRPMRRW